MGIPSLLTLLAILAALVWRSWGLYRRGTCDIDRIIGLGAVAIVAGLVGVNMFGTHVIDTSVDGFFWVYLAIVARLLPPAAQPTSAKNKHAPRRR
jgi:O-antigen ligase